MEVETVSNSFAKALQIVIHRHTSLRATFDLLWQSDWMDIEIERWNSTHTLNPADLKTRLINEGYSVRQWSDPAGTKYGPHSHDEDQTHWILSGALELRVGYEVYTLHPGDRDFLPANTMHSATVPGDQAVTYLIGSKH